MKKILFVLLMFQSVIMFSKDDIKVKIEQKDGSFLTYNLIDIKEINFQDYSLSSFCIIYIKPDSVFSIPNYKIISITLKNGINNIDSFSIYYNYSPNEKRYINIPLHVLDSIKFINTNELLGKVYKNIKFDIINLDAEYYNSIYYSTPEPGGNYTSNAKFNKTIDVVNYFSSGSFYPNYWSCESCFSQKRIGDLFYCNNKASYSITHCTCDLTKCYLFLDTVKMIIDSLFFSYDGKNYYPSQRGGGWRDETDYTESLVLYSIPYSLNINDSILVNYKIFDLSLIKYNFHSTRVVGNGGNHSVSDTYFTKFLPLTDSATISIVIRE